jgi:hypothetical protein
VHARDVTGTCDVENQDGATAVRMEIIKTSERPMARRDKIADLAANGHEACIRSAES